jgi:hypothetical protein
MFFEHPGVFLMCEVKVAMTKVALPDADPPIPEFGAAPRKRILDPVLRDEASFDFVPIKHCKPQPTLMPRRSYKQYWNYDRERYAKFRRQSIRGFR